MFEETPAEIGSVDVTLQTPDGDVDVASHHILLRRGTDGGTVVSVDRRSLGGVVASERPAVRYEVETRA